LELVVDGNGLPWLAAYPNFIEVASVDLMYLSLHTSDGIPKLGGCKLIAIVVIVYHDQQISITIIKHILNEKI